MDQAQDPTGRGKVAIVLVWLWLAVTCLEHLASLFTIAVLGGFGGDIAAQQQLQLADIYTKWTSFGSLVALVVTGIAVLRWISLTNRNAQTWSDQVEVTPGWAVGWFFVPVACLFVPFKGVSATWRATLMPADIESVPVPAILRWWWGLWLAMNFAGYLPSYLLLHAVTPDQLIIARWWSAAEILIDVPLALVLVRVIARLSAMQREVLIERERTIDHDHEYAS
ncbi:DUF4328 domain-containing protein [Sphingomonas sp. CLY1604]|uniref:DUF4328 domain-containing protein n=1 Tax=Sphingomonas sp. CLY1604 TaxID=3457786 RepID=UPI003FD715AD